MDGCHLKGRLLFPLRSEQVGIGAAWMRNASFGPGACTTRLGAHGIGAPTKLTSPGGALYLQRVGSPKVSACPYAVTEIVEQRHAVRLGPDADGAAARDVIVF